MRIDKKSGGYAQKTIKEHYTFLNSLLKVAVFWRMATSNPMIYVKKPEVDKKEAGFYDEEQIPILLENVETEYRKYVTMATNSLNARKYKHNQKKALERYYINWITGYQRKVYVLIGLTSACRRDEMLGLEEDDFDFEHNIMKIQRVSLYTKERGIYTKDKLKNGAPSKIIDMPQHVMDVVKDYISVLKEARLNLTRGAIKR